MTLPLLRRLHKWVALALGLQVALWCVSGTMFAWLDHHRVEGAHLTAPAPPAPVPSELALANPRAVAATDPALRELRLQRLSDRWVYALASDAGTRLVDARTGTPVAIDATIVRSLARERYAGSGRLVRIEFHAHPTLETRTHGAAWAAAFDDDDGTTLWFAADDGRLLETRTDAWRLFDVFWMLHTMDYAGRDDFNHPLVILCATGALWVGLTGLWLVLRVFRRARPAVS